MIDFHKLKLIVLDVDGTLTDGGVYYDSEGHEIKRFDVKDGLGIKVAQDDHLAFAIITGRESPMVKRRAEELGIAYFRTGVQIKYPALKELLCELHLQPDQCGYIGDDWNDYEAMTAVGFKACPADAPDDIKAVCDYVAAHRGGQGAVRDCLEYILRRRGTWETCAKQRYSSTEGTV